MRYGNPMNTAPAESVRFERARGTGRLAVRRRDGRTALDTLYQDGCAKIRLPRTHSDGIEAALINIAGGLTGGDHIEWQAEAGPGTRLTLTTPACERLYRSLGPAARIETRLTAGPGAHIDWLPQETILFEDSRLERSLVVDLAGDATFTAIETVLLGRDGMGETARRARLSDSWRISREGRLIHAEETRLGRDPDRERDGLALLSGARAFATLLHIAPDAERRLERLAPVLPDDSRIGASVIGEKLVLRAMDGSGLALRRLLVPILAALAMGGLPRLWHF